MARKKGRRKSKIIKKRVDKNFSLPSLHFNLPEGTQKLILGVLMFLGAILMVFSFFGSAGAAGRLFFEGSFFLIGKATFILPLLFVLSGIVFFYLKNQNKWQVFLGLLLIILGLAGFFGALNPQEKDGGLVGFIEALVLTKAFGFWAAEIIFTAIIFIGGIILIKTLPLAELGFFKEREEEGSNGSFKPRIAIKRVFEPKFKVKEIHSIVPQKIESIQEKPEIKLFPDLIPKKIPVKNSGNGKPKFPPLNIFKSSKEVPQAGDIKINSAIIKKTLQNFGIPVEMSEVHIGPTVTQYTLKPAEGIKLSRITALANDLALALAAPSIRIEAPIPGRSLVGIEVPNATRAQVRMRDLLEHPTFQNSPSPLLFALGKDVTGSPVFVDLARLPHLLVAGSTGTGKTVTLNEIICSLIYRNSPRILRFILVDPKRVEFSLYEEAPHLLTPVIHDVYRALNAVKWLIAEMERRFQVLSKARSRDIVSYNEKAENSEDLIPLPYIVLVVDELADLMAARGRELEAGIVRLAQMARAVGIHLILATQRPSVEVLTGLIKANITARIALQVASQIDSRTILDISGAEKLLGRGDMLFVSGETVKPKRIQGAFVSESEIKGLISYLKKHYTQDSGEEYLKEDDLGEELSPEKVTKDIEEGIGSEYFGEEDPLYEEAKRIVIEARKASASLLQRRLRVGYARAARLIDMLEEKGVVGPAEGAKPREVYITEDNNSNIKNN